MKMIIDYVHVHSGFIILSITLFVIAGFAAWKIARSYMADGAQNDLDFYWQKFDDEISCDYIYNFWSQGDRLIKEYHILPVGCSSRVMFCERAFEGLNYGISYTQKKFDEEEAKSPSTAKVMSEAFAYRMTMLRQDLETLKKQLEMLQPECAESTLATCGM